MSMPLTFYMIVTVILDRGKSKNLIDILGDDEVYFTTIMPGRGTAKKKILSYLGLGESEKDIVLIGGPAKKAEGLIEHIKEKMHLDRPGKGIAFSIPINNIADAASKAVLKGQTQDKEGVSMGETTHNVIISIMNHGYADDVMDTARDAGAPGGTILRAHGSVGVKQAEKFFGITIQPDKDVLLIIADEKQCSRLMSAISMNHGIGHDAGAITFSMPICNISGLAMAE